MAVNAIIERRAATRLKLLTEFAIEVSRPPQILRPNGSHGHWAQVRKARDAAHLEAKICTRNALEDYSFVVPLGRRICINYTEMLGPRARAMDDDNLAASMKAYRDGIADALGVDDKLMRVQEAGDAVRGDRSGVLVRVWIEQGEP